ncbi:polyprenol monophosphomannose synthase [Candidatus Omnitrophota bacterium]
MKTIVVLPTYNEAENIEELITTILKTYSDFEILIIDDGSPDGTGPIVSRLSRQYSNVHLMQRSRKLGLASAYQEGFTWALQREFDYIVQMDADFSHDPKHISAMLERAKAGVGLVIGSRYNDGAMIKDWFLLRAFVSRIANLYARSILRLKIYDLTGGFRCFRADTLREIDLSSIRSKGYAFQIEMAYLCRKRQRSVEEIPIVFSERRQGRSKFSLQCIIEAFFLVLRLAIG